MNDNKQPKTVFLAPCGATLDGDGIVFDSFSSGDTRTRVFRTREDARAYAGRFCDDDWNPDDDVIELTVG